MYITSFLLMIGGAISAIYGYCEKNSTEAVLQSYLSDGDGPSRAEIYLIGGIIFFVLGLLLYVEQSQKRSIQNNQHSNMNNIQPKAGDWICTCGHVCKSTENFCTVCGIKRPNGGA